MAPDVGEPATEGVARSLKGKRQSKSTEDCCHRMTVNDDALVVAVAVVILGLDHERGGACDSCLYPYGKALESDRL